MARFAFSLLAVLPAASYLMANSAQVTLEDLCKDTYYAGYCVRLIRPTVFKSTSFNSVEWQRKALNRVLARALIAKRYMVSQAELVDATQATSLKSCTHMLHASAKLIKEASMEFGTKNFDKSAMLSKLDTASSNQEACSDLLEDAGSGIMRKVRDHANEANMASRIVQADESKYCAYVRECIFREIVEEANEYLKGCKTMETKSSRLKWLAGRQRDEKSVIVTCAELAK
ncbi:hypothetical protein ACH5RR_014816 [Cinchona calisaya]|uniref:Pectinesterase inhibitor domain-containing protein n=1 Tax=Cinchona calisaya TaxID=153742 RepID=A0ABD2ZRC5_9GENT